MVLPISDQDKRPAMGGRGTAVIWGALATIGASGAPTLVDNDPGIGLTRTGAGTYDLVFPPGNKARVRVWTQKSVTVWHVDFTAYDDQAGTATFKTKNNAATPADTDPANGDILGIEIISYAFSQ